MSRTLPANLYNEMVGGLQMMLALRLSGAPAADTVGALAQAWEIALTCNRVWDATLDAGRFQTAFAVLAGQINRWPVPADVLNALPPRPEPPKLAHRYAPTAAEKAQGKDNLRRIAESVKAVLLNKKMPPGEPETPFTQQVLQHREKVADLIQREKGNRNG
ncbi:hypothetical protein [Neisseria perflava]|uniref:hypothetical protein n=1 Tax=Neisseria perflava TaxID=33053 RepID=UPI00209C9FC3|nr:hypothetical protein [Neisseria perflava]MCP1659311.1 hypothetical protein [Neisseria perflava]